MDMNKLHNALRAQILRSPYEGMGIRPTARLFNVRPHTVMNLMVRAGEHCGMLHDTHIHGLHSPTSRSTKCGAWSGLTSIAARMR